MKKITMIAASLLMLAGATMFAQGPRGGRSGGMPQGMMMGASMRPQPETDMELIAAYTDYMAEKLSLTPEQKEKYTALNEQYAGKVLLPIPEQLRKKIRKQHKADGQADTLAEGRRGRKRHERENDMAMDSTELAMRRDFRNMQNVSEEEREEMKKRMEARMEEAQARLDELDELQDEYHDALKAILDQEQIKLYRRELRREEERLSRKMQSEMRRRMQMEGGSRGPRR